MVCSIVPHSLPGWFILGLYPPSKLSLMPFPAICSSSFPACQGNAAPYPWTFPATFTLGQSLSATLLWNSRTPGSPSGSCDLPSPLPYPDWSQTNDVSPFLISWNLSIGQLFVTVPTWISLKTCAQRCLGLFRPIPFTWNKPFLWNLKAESLLLPSLPGPCHNLHLALYSKWF